MVEVNVVYAIIAVCSAVGFFAIISILCNYCKPCAMICWEGLQFARTTCCCPCCKKPDPPAATNPSAPPDHPIYIATFIGGSETAKTIHLPDVPSTPITRE
jgi:hypothetical protein